MALTPSTMLPLGTTAPDFRLVDTNGRTLALSDLSRGASAVLVMFICNHCPYVKHLKKQIAALARDYQEEEVTIVAINSNDVENYPEDSVDKMSLDAGAYGYTFPYLYDEDQEVAKAYQAACTPDFYVFDRFRRLTYRGQFDESRPGSDIPVSGRDVRAALDAAIAGKPPIADQKPSVGCNIKWKAGNAPSYFTPKAKS